MAEKGAAAVRSEQIWLDGQFVPFDQARVHVLTHSLHYGYGVFEGMRCYMGDDGRSAIFRAREHIRRLFESAHILEISDHLPIKIEFIEAREKVDAVLPELEKRIGSGLIEVQETTIIVPPHV